MNEKIGWFCGTALILGTLFFIYKADMCGVGPGCHETIKHVGEGRDNPTCDVGATIEVLPNGFVACHCGQKNVQN